MASMRKAYEQSSSCRTGHCGRRERSFPWWSVWETFGFSVGFL